MRRLGKLVFFLLIASCFLPLKHTQATTFTTSYRSEGGSYITINAGISAFKFQEGEQTVTIRIAIRLGSQIRQANLVVNLRVYLHHGIYISETFTTDDTIHKEESFVYEEHWKPNPLEIKFSLSESGLYSSYNYDGNWEVMFRLEQGIKAEFIVPLVVILGLSGIYLQIYRKRPYSKDKKISSEGDESQLEAVETRSIKQVEDKEIIERSTSKTKEIVVLDYDIDNSNSRERYSQFFKFTGIASLFVLPLISVNIGLMFFFDKIKYSRFLFDLLTALTLILFLVVIYKLIRFKNWKVKHYKRLKIIKNLLRTSFIIVSLLIIINVISAITYLLLRETDNLSNFTVMTNRFLNPILAGFVFITLFSIFVSNLRKEIPLSFLLFGVFFCSYIFLSWSLVDLFWANAPSPPHLDFVERYYIYVLRPSWIVVNAVLASIILWLAFDLYRISRNLLRKEKYGEIPTDKYITKEIIIEDKGSKTQKKKEPIKTLPMSTIKKTPPMFISGIMFLFSMLIFYDEKITDFWQSFDVGKTANWIIVYVSYLTILIFLIWLKVKVKKVKRLVRAITYTIIFVLVGISYNVFSEFGFLGYYFFGWEVISMAGNFFQFLAFLNIALMLKNYNKKLQNPIIWLFGSIAVIPFTMSIFYASSTFGLRFIHPIGMLFMKIFYLLEVICLGIIGLKFIIDQLISPK